MHAWAHQHAELRRLPTGHRALWWEPGVGKTLPLAVAGREIGLPQLWLTLSQGGLLPAQTALAIRDARGDGARIQVITSGQDRVDTRADVVVCSYDLMRNPSIWKQLYRLTWGSLVLDEAHALANTASARTRAVYGAKQESKGALFRRAAHVWPASGTPVLNNPMELWSHVSRLWPEISLPRKQDWQDHYCLTRSTDYGTQVIGAKNLPELRAKVASVSSIRTLLQTAPDIPPLTIDGVDIEITAAARATLEASMDEQQRGEIHRLLAEIEGGDEWAEVQLQAMALPLAGVRRVLATAKAAQVAALVAGELEGGTDRVLVFGHHVDALQRVQTALRGYGAGLLNGSTSPAQRQVAVDRFTAGRDRVLVANIAAGGIGLNLQACRRVVFLEASWTPGNNVQALRRCFRAGQTRPVHVTFTSVPRSIDRAVTTVLRRKAKIIEGIMGHAS